MSRSVNTNADELFMLQSAPISGDEQAIRDALNEFISGQNTGYDYYITTKNISPHTFQEKTITKLRAPTVEDVERFSFAGLIMNKELSDVDNELSFPSAIYIGPYAFAETDGINKITNLKKVQYLGQNLKITRTETSVSYKDIGKIQLDNGKFKYLQPYGNVFAYGDDCEHTEKEKIKINSISLPNILTIPFEAFNNSKMKNIELNRLGIEVGPSAFKDSTELTEVNGLLIYIDSDAFLNDNKLEEVRTSRCSAVGYEAFWNCSNLTNINLSNCEYIGHYAFQNSNVTEITCYNLKEIGSYAFENCKNLTRITLGSKITKIPYKTFANCHLQSITLDTPEVIEIEEDTFEESISTETTKIYVNSESIKEKYLQNEIWKNYEACFVVSPYQILAADNENKTPIATQEGYYITPYRKEN